MKKKLKIASIIPLFFMQACAATKEMPPVVQEEKTIIKIVEKNVCKEEPLQKKVQKTHPLGIIGGVEPVKFLPMKTSILARIDTGAENSSLGAENINVFEREGEKWVSFEIKNPQTEEPLTFEKKVLKQVVIKRQLEQEERIAVMLTVQLGSEKITAQFSLADRSKFEYQALIGRNILSGRALVDASLEKTLY